MHCNYNSCDCRDCQAEVIRQLKLRVENLTKTLQSAQTDAWKRIWDRYALENKVASLETRLDYVNDLFIKTMVERDRAESRLRAVRAALDAKNDEVAQ